MSRKYKTKINYSKKTKRKRNKTKQNKVTKRRRKNNRNHKYKDNKDGGALAALGAAAKTGAALAGAHIARKASKKIAVFGKKKIKKLLSWIVSSIETCFNEALQSYTNPFANKSEIKEKFIKCFKNKLYKDVENKAKEFSMPVKILKEFVDSTIENFKSGGYPDQVYPDLQGLTDDERYKDETLMPQTPSGYSEFGPSYAEVDEFKS